jgi:hypothetical protein
LFPKYHLLENNVASVHSLNTMSQPIWQQFLQAGPTPEVAPATLNWMGVEYVVLPYDQSWPGGVPLSDALSRRHNVRVWQNPQALPHAWLVHRLETSTSLEALPSMTRQQLQTLLFPAGRPRDLRRSALVEPKAYTDLAEQTVVAGESCAMVTERPGHVEVQATLTRPGMVVVSQQYDPGWQVELVTDNNVRRGSILRVNFVMQGVLLPPGQHRLLFRYRPPYFWQGLATSSVGWMLLIAMGTVHLVRRDWRMGRSQI